MTAYYLLVFLTFISLVIYPIGYLLLQKFSFEEGSLVPKVLLSVILGLWLVMTECFLLGKVGLWKLVPALAIIQSLSSITYLRKSLLRGEFKLDILVVFLITVVVGVNALMTVPFGVINGDNLKLGGVHGTDSNWHLSLINSIEKGVPPGNPLYSGKTLTNYHYLSDLQIAVIKTVTRIPVDVLFYQIMGPFYICLYVSLAYLIGKKLTESRFGGITAVLLASLSSNWYYLANYLYPTSYKWPSVAWVDYFSSKSVNYPLLFSIVLFFGLIYFF